MTLPLKIRCRIKGDIIAHFIWYVPFMKFNVYLYSFVSFRLIFSFRVTSTCVCSSFHNPQPEEPKSTCPPFSGYTVNFFKVSHSLLLSVSFKSLYKPFSLNLLFKITVGLHDHIRFLWINLPFR